MPRGEARVAVASAAGLYIVGATLIATSWLLPEVSSPAGAAAVAVTAYVTAAVLITVVRRDRGGLLLAWIADLWGLVLIVFLVASTGGASSPFALLYFFAIGHAAAFQPRERFIWVCVAGLVLFLAPIAYSDVSASFGAIACVGAVLALLTVGVIHLALERMRDQRRRLVFLIAATAQLETSLDPRRTLQRIAGMAVPQIADLCVIDVLGAGGTVTSSVARSRDVRLALRTEDAHAQSPPDPHRTGPISRALRSGRPQVVQAKPRDGGPPEAEHPDSRLMGEAGLTALAAIPMVARGRMLGAISYLRDEPFSNGELELLEDLTGRASLAFDNARLYAERAHVAHTLRHSLMPAALPVVPGLQLESFFKPMGAGGEVGGDFYDVFADRCSCWLVIGDVCGKGPEAAVLTGFLRHTTVAYAREASSPASVLERVNMAMLENDFDGRFATAVLARLTFTDRGVEVTLAAAGHPGALISRGEGGAEELGAFGTLLGVFPDPEIPERATLLRPGDALALYTDGLAEAHAPDRVLTVEEMVGKLAALPPRSARGTIDTLLALVDLDDYARDDVAILAAQVVGAPVAEPEPGAPAPPHARAGARPANVAQGG
jgi:serine phosphatase RsbU (regulator of sigma subunit)